MSCNNEGRSDLLLGIMSFLNSSPKVLATIAITVPVTDDIKLPDGVEYIEYNNTIRKMFQTDPQMFKEPPPSTAVDYINRGKEARRGGALSSPFLVPFRPWPTTRPTYEVDLYPRINIHSWNSFESTLDLAIFQDKRRHKTLAEWKDGSCAVDAVLFAGIFANTAVQQADCLTLEAFINLEPLQMKFREVLSQPWGTLTQQERNKLRDSWRVLVEKKMNVAGHSGEKRWLDINDVVQATFQSFPSVTFTTLEGWRCCGGSFQTRTDQEAQRWTTIHLGYHDASRKAAEQITDVLCHIENNDGQTRRKRCRRDDCTGSQQRTRIVVDRLPPMLIIQYLPGRPISDSKEIQLFEDILITYHQPTGKKRKGYAVIGCILCTGRAQNHFVARWRHGHKFFHYNSLQSPKIKAIRSFLDKYDGVTSSDTVRTVFYADKRSVSSATDQNARS